MDIETLIEQVEFADEDLVRSVTDELVQQVYDSRASETMNGSVDEVVSFLAENGYDSNSIAQMLMQIGAIEDPITDLGL